MRKIAQNVADRRNLDTALRLLRLPQNPCQWHQPAEPQPGGKQMPGLIELMGDPGSALVHRSVSDPTETCKQSKREDQDDRPLRLSIEASENEHRREQQMPAPHP